jgi:Rne/Rng family ribonuclease
MAKELFISTTPHETKVAVVDDEQLSEIYFERENEYTLAGSIYKGRVTRVLPGMQSAFVDIGLERDAFLYVTDFLEEQEDQEDFEQVSDRGEPQQRSSQATSSSAEPKAAGGDENRSAQEPESSEQQFERGARRWRGRRGRRRGRGGFQEQGGQQSGPETAESFENEESAEGGEQEQIVLPGESLSKYRHAEVEAEAASEPQTIQESHRAEPVRPSEPVPSESHRSEPAPGGSLSVLPGESISKYRGGDSGQSSAEPQPEKQPSRFARFRKRFESRWEKPNRRQENESQKEESAPAGPPVFALPGESLAKYRGRESSSLEPASVQQHRTEVREYAGQSQPSQVESVTQDQTPEVHREHHATAANVHYTEPERTDSDERVEHALQGEESRSSEAASANELVPHEEQEQSERSLSHEFGSGVVEEELIDEEESDVLPIGEHLDEEVYEELEEETLDADNAQQLVEAVREAHVNQRLGLQQGEPSDLEDQPSGEEVESSGNGHASPEQIEAVDMEDAAYEEQASEESAGEEESAPEPTVEAEEGRAELRAPANTAAFQQRTERTERGGPDRFRRGRRGRPMRGRRNIQRESQPTISELLKEGQEILVQIAKEPMAKKGARITSHIALPGRFLVYMPTVNHVGVSRKIGSDDERQRLKRILISEKGSAHGGFIVRTAAAGASEEDLRSDLRFLINLWNDIKSRSENSKAPALIYHDLNLVERILRDQVTSNFTSIWVDNEQEYERIVRFLGRFQPAMVRRAKLYTKDTPLFEQFGIQEEINNALKSKVWLKSGGYIVINQTEALVAIDINTGKYVGKTQRLEDTIVKTNIDAIREIVRQIRLRDLGGIIVIDFIDMDERKNRQKVMQALEEALKSDRAPSKVLQFNDFGLVAITRKRVKQSLERTLSTACSYCTGTGMIKSVQTVCNEIYVEMRKMSRNLERHDVMLRVNPEVVKALKANSARWLQEMEELTGKTIIVKSDPVLHQEQFDIN